MLFRSGFVKCLSREGFASSAGWRVEHNGERCAHSLGRQLDANNRYDRYDRYDRYVGYDGSEEGASDSQLS